MITKSTVLVLGAGASVPYSFPTGQELRNFVIASSADHFRSVAGREEQRNNSREARKAQQRADMAREFQDSLKYARQVSVDAFLEHRPDMLDIGKAWDRINDHGHAHLVPPVCTMFAWQLNCGRVGRPADCSERHASLD